MSVFIVDDEELLRRGLVDMLTRYDDIAVVGTASSAEEALEQITRARPQLVLLDARVAEGAGIAACRALRAAHPELRCLVLTSFDDDEALLAAVLAGAAGYLVKQLGGSGLVDGIRQVGQGGTLLDPEATDSLLERLRRAAQADPRTAALTATDEQVLELVSQGCTDAEIEAKLGLAAVDVRRHVADIFLTLGPRGRSTGPLLGSGLRGGQVPAPEETAG